MVYLSIVSAGVYVVGISVTYAIASYVDARAGLEDDLRRTSTRENVIYSFLWPLVISMLVVAVLIVLPGRTLGDAAAALGERHARRNRRVAR